MVNPAKILIIDDDAGIRNLLERSLAPQGYEFTFATEGPEGLEMIQTGDFDVVILDLMLPEMNGLEILRRVQGRLPHTEIVVLTGFASLRTAIEALRLGAYDYIAKPFPLDAVRSAVRRALEKRRMEAQLAAIYELSREMTLLSDVEEVAEAVLEIVNQVLKYESCGLWLIDTGAQKIAPVATRMLDLTTTRPSFSLDSERSIIVAVARSGETIYAPDTHKDPRYVNLGTDSRSELAVPLLVEGRPIGVLNVESRDIDAFSPNDERLLSTLAAQAAVAIQSARRYQRAQHEIAERERAEEALQGSENRFRALVESSADHIFMLDPTGVYLASNEQVKRINREEVRSIVGATLEDIYPPDVAATYRWQLGTVLDTGESVEFEHPVEEADGLHHHRDTLYPIWRDGEIWAVGGLCRDITPQKRAEEALRRSETRFRRLLSSSEDMIFGIDREGIFWAAGGKRLQELGLEPTDVIGHSIYDIFPPDEADQYHARHQQVFETGEPITYEHTYEFNGVTSTDLTTVYPVESQEGEIELLGIICRDIADLKRTEAELRHRSAQMEALREVALELATQLDLDALLESIVIRASELVGGTGGGVYLYRPEKDVIEWTVSVGPLDTPLGSTLQRGEGLSGVVWDTGDPLAVTDYQAWPGRAAAWAEHASQALVGVPIRWGEELLGVLNVRAPVGHVFAPSEIETLTLFAAHAAAALQNARSYHALEESEERYRATLDAMGDAIQVVDTDLRFTLFNRRWREWGEELGWDRDVMGKRLFDVIEFLPDHVRDEYEQVFETGEVLDTEERTVVDGQEIITETRKIPILEDDEVARVVTVVRDVTEQRLAEEARRASEEKYRTLIEESLQGVLIFRDGRIVFANPAMSQTLDRPIEEITALSPQGVEELIHPDDREEVMGRIRRRFQGSEVPPRTDFRIVRQDGDIRWLDVTTSLIEYQDELAIQAFSIDITDRKRAEEAQQARTAQLEALRQVGLDLTAQLDLEELLSAIVVHAVDLVDGIAGGLSLYSAEQDALDFTIHTGIDSVPDNVQLARGEGLSGTVWETGEPLILDDYQAWDGGVKAWAERIGNFADIGVPIWWGEEFLGVLEVMKEHPRTFSQEDAELLQLFAIEAAVAIHNAQLYEQAQREIAERQRAEAALQESEREKALILNTAQEMFVYYDTSLRIQWVNRAAAESIGCNPGELVGQHCYEVWQQRHQPCPGCPVLQARETGEAQETEMTTPDGRIWYIRGYPVFDDQGETIALIEFGRDITARKQAEMESQRRNEELTALYKTGQALSSTLDLDEVLTQVLVETREILVAEAASVLLYDAATEELFFAAAVGTATDGLVGARMPAVEGVAGWAMQNAEPVLVADVQDDPRFYNGIDQVTGLTTRSLLAVPLIAKGEVIGVLEAVKRSGEPFDEHDLRLATTLAGSAATAIENARLYEQTARRLAHTQTLRSVMQATASTLDFDQAVKRAIEAIHRVLDIEYLGLVLPDPSGEFLLVHPAQIGFGKEQLGLRLPMEGSICGRAYTTGKSVRVDDVSQEPDYVATIPELQSELAVPVPMEGEIVAVLNAESPRPDAFSGDEQQTLEAIAAQLGVALKNTQLYQAEQHRREVAEALRETSQVVNSSLRQEEILPRILEQLAQVVDYDSSSVLLDTGDRFEVVAARGFEDLSRVLGTTFDPQPEDLFSILAAEQRAVVIEDVQQDPRWQEHDLDGGIHGWIGAPLLVRDEMIGILAVDNCEPGAYDTEDGEVVFAFASHVAVALENARLYEAEREQRQLLEQSQAQLVQSEKLAATGRLAASLAHEINNPLQAIHNGLQLLLTFPMNPEEQREYLQMADEEVERLMEMVARILDFARRPERRMKPTQLNAVVEKVLALAGKYLQHRHVVLERDLEEDLPPLLATPDELGQVFLNMIINALDAMPEGGTLRVSTRQTENGRLAATFADTGQGIAPEHVDRIFEPFFSTKEGGTGLGLSVSYNVVKRHGGEITVESTLGEGSQFTVWLPASRGA